MHHKNKIYDDTALTMFGLLEAFLKPLGIKPRDASETRITTIAQKIDAFERKHSKHKETQRAARAVAELMRDINRTRNDIIHPHNVDQLVKYPSEPIVHFKTLNGFEGFRGKCLRLDGMLLSPPFEARLGMGEVMIPTLKYAMGNLGDIIKHGVLAEFVEWWFESGNAEMIFADTFAGCPWGGTTEVFRRLKHLTQMSGGNAALLRFYAEEARQGNSKYFGSSHLVKRIGDNCGKAINLVVSDNCPEARKNLKASGLSVSHLPNNNDGFEILNAPTFSEHKPNLVLLDPYGDFLREEWRSSGERLEKINKLTQANKSLWVILFVLDKWPEINEPSRKTVQDTHDRYIECRDKHFNGKAVYLRCPKAKDSRIKGEDNYDAEVLLISEQLRDKSNADVKGLLRRLEAFAGMATNALAKEKGLVLAGDGEVKYKEV